VQSGLHKACEMLWSSLSRREATSSCTGSNRSSLACGLITSVTNRSARKFYVAMAGDPATSEEPTT